MPRTMSQLTLRAQFDADQRERTDEERAEIDRVLDRILCVIDRALAKHGETRKPFFPKHDLINLTTGKSPLICALLDAGHSEQSVADRAEVSKSWVRRVKCEKLKGMAGQ